MLFIQTISSAQSNWSRIAFEGFEYTTPCPDVIKGQVYHPIPSDKSNHSGKKGLYLNFVNKKKGAAYRKTFKTKSNTTYRFQYWMRETWNHSNDITVNIYDKKNKLLCSVHTITNGKWQQITSQAFKTKSKSITFELVTNIPGGQGTNDLSFDDLSLQMKPESKKSKNSNPSKEIPMWNDTTICNGKTWLLNPGKTYDSFKWNNGSKASTLLVKESGTYSVELRKAGTDLVKNGNFDNASGVFKTQYNKGTGGTWGLLSKEGQYAIAKTPRATHKAFPATVDHSGNGNLLVINGAPTPQKKIWMQTIKIEPNTSYLLETWAMNFSTNNPSNLTFLINGKPVGETFYPTPIRKWKLFSFEWYSGDLAEIELSIVCNNLQRGGNDFGIDDISFRPLIKSKQTVRVNYINCDVEEVEITPGSTDFDEDQFKPTNIVFLLDVSESMQSDYKINLLRIAMLEVSKMLRSIDKISIVTYSSEAKIALRTIKGNDVVLTERAIRSLKTGGTTSGSPDGLKMAYKQAKKSLIKNENNLVLMVTDGAFSTGLGEMMTTIKKYQSKNITLSIVGIMNKEHEKKTLKRMAENGNGLYISVNDPNQTKDAFIKDIKRSAKK